MRQTVKAWPTREERYVPQAQRGKLYGWNEPWRGPILLQACAWMGVDACAADMLVTRTWLHHKHHCRLLRVSAQVERSMGGGSAAPCFAEARWEVSGAAGLRYGLGCPKSAQCTRQTVKSWLKRQDCCVEHMVAPPASLQSAPGQCTSRTKHGWG